MEMENPEDIELHITPSADGFADDILEVSPVNSTTTGISTIYASPASAAPTPTAAMAAAASATSPSTSSLRHARRTQNLMNEDAFSSSSEGTTDGTHDDHSLAGTGTGSSRDDDSVSSSGSSEDSRRRNRSSRRKLPSTTISTSSNNLGPAADPLSFKKPPSSPSTRQRGRGDPAATNSIMSHTSINNKGQRQASSSPQSEFDKALLKGVPARGYATSFFASDSNDGSDANYNLNDALSTATDLTKSNPQQQSSVAGQSPAASWEDGEGSAAPRRSSQQSHQQPPKKEKERKQHRVNITATTHPSSASAHAISSAASSTYPSTSHAGHNNKSSASFDAGVLRNSNNSNQYSSNATANSDYGSVDNTAMSNNNNNGSNSHHHNSSNNNNDPEDLSMGVLPDVLMNMRQKIESMQLFDSDMMKLAAVDDMAAETRESLKRSSQQSISAAVLVSLAHKRYERRRLAAMEIEKVVRSLVQQGELERVRAILLLLSDDYVRSTNEDARKGGVVALAACAIGLKKAADVSNVMECRDLILASVVHACQDHSQRVRYYATESLFNVVKVIPGLAVQHFFILFEILRSLYADVDVDVRSGAELLDKKLKEVIVGAMNSGSFSTDACVPVFARFVYIRNKPTKRLTLTWLQELNEKLIGAPILEFLHLFLGGIFDMVADPSVAIRQSALAFLQSVLPKLLVINSEAIDDMDDSGMKVDFDKILQSLVTTMEHPDPFVRKVAMYWMSRIVKAHMKELHARSQTKSSSPTMMNPDGRVSPSRKNDGDDSGDERDEEDGKDGADGKRKSSKTESSHFSTASISVRNSLPHVLPGILLSIGDTFNSKSGSAKDSFLPDQTTNELAEQTNACLRDAVRRDGQSYVQHLDSFIVALREELDAPGGLSSKNPPAEERKLYRIDVSRDGTGIESPGWFRASNDTKERNEESMVSSRLCALHWVIVLYESVVPDELKAEYAREFIIPIIHQLVDNPPERIVFKSLEVLAKITVPVSGEDKTRLERQSPRGPSGTTSLSGFNTPSPSWAAPVDNYQDDEEESEFPMTDANATFALDILHPSRRKFKSRDREVFTALIQLHSHNQQLLADLSRLITFMCRLQPPEFVFVSFAVELDRFVRRVQKRRQNESEMQTSAESEHYLDASKRQKRPFSGDLEFVSSFVQQMCHVLLNTEEAKPLRDTLRDCVGFMPNPNEHRRVRLFHIILHSFSHSVVATVSLCLWGGAYRTASMFLSSLVPLDINLMFLLELDQLVEQLERPLFRHLHVRMLERNEDPESEGSGAQLFKTLKFLLMIIPQSTCYSVLKDRLVSISRFRQSTAMTPADFLDVRQELNVTDKKRINDQTEVFVERVLRVRAIHCDAMWQTIRSESLETKPLVKPNPVHEEGESRRQWLGYASKEEQRKAEERYRREKLSQQQGTGLSIEELKGYQELGEEPTDSAIEQQLNETVQRESEREDLPSLRVKGTNKEESKDDDAWKAYWEND